MAEDGGLERKFRNGLLLQVLFEFLLEFFGHISYLKLNKLAYCKSSLLLHLFVSNPGVRINLVISGMILHQYWTSCVAALIYLNYGKAGRRKFQR